MSESTTALVADDGPLGDSAHLEESRREQRRADKWLIVGSALIGASLPGIIGLFVFLKGLSIQRDAHKRGLTMRPMIVTLIGYMVFIDAALNTFGWITDIFASESLLFHTYIMEWGNFFDAGYYWHFNQIGIGGASAPGEKAWEIGLILTVFPMRMAACIGFLQMKRWGHQWLIVTCWMGVVIWIGYTANMTIFADVRYTGVVAPVYGWWIFNLFYITPFVALPYLHTVNRAAFSDGTTPPAAQVATATGTDAMAIGTTATTARLHRRVRRVCYGLLVGLVLEGAVSMPLLMVWYGWPTLSVQQICTELERHDYSDITRSCPNHYPLSGTPFGGKPDGADATTTTDAGVVQPRPTISRIGFRDLVTMYHHDEATLHSGGK
jgi:hypothetical protein